MNENYVVLKRYVTIWIDGQDHVVEVYPHRGDDPRYQLYFQEGDRRFEATLIRTVVGHWLCTGENVPSWAKQHAATIAKTIRQH